MLSFLKDSLIVLCLNTSVQAVTCETTVEQLCPFHKPASHCPRYCVLNFLHFLPVNEGLLPEITAFA